MKARNSLATTLLRGAIGYSLLVATVLLVAYVWERDSLKTLAMGACVAPIVFTLCATPFLLIILAWSRWERRKEGSNQEDSD